MNKSLLLQLLIVGMMFVNLLTLDFTDALSWASNKTNYINIILAVVLLMVVLLKEMPEKENQ